MPVAEIVRREELSQASLLLIPKAVPEPASTAAGVPDTSNSCTKAHQLDCDHPEVVDILYTVSGGLERCRLSSGPLCRSGLTGSKMSKFAQGLSKLKLKEVPTYVKEHAGG